MAEPFEQWVDELLNLNDEDVKLTEKQIKIIQAAVEVFAEKGYAASSTSEIAQKAGVAEGTIFRHYKTKKDLLLSIVAPLMSKLIAPFILKDFNKVLDATYARYEDFLRAVIHNRQEFVRKHLPVIKILLQEVPFHPELQEQFKEHVAGKVLERFKNIVEHYQKEGQIIDIPPYSVIRMTASNILGFFITRYLLAPDQEWDDEREIEMMVRFIVRGLAPEESR